MNRQLKNGTAPVRISVVVPSWRDTQNLAVLLPALSRLDRVSETIVVDACGDAACAQIARDSGAMFLICPRPNRGQQMNMGAAAARGEVLVFQHSDTDLSDEHLAAIEVAMTDSRTVGGAFFRKFDGRHPRLMWLENVARFLTLHGGTLYGDQSIFVRRDIFCTLGGYAEIPLMEDVEFSRRLRTAGKIAVLDPPVQSSARRHLRRGPWRTSIQNGLLIVFYRLGVSPERLHRWYYGLPKPRAATARLEVRADSFH